MSKLIINAERMFDGQNIKSNVSVLVEDGVIKDIGKPGNFRGKTIETKFLAPGLIDMHMHLGSYAGLYYKEIKLFEYFNKLLLFNGITTVRDVGSHINTIYNFKNMPGPIPNIFSSVFIDGNRPLWRMSFIVNKESQIKEIINSYKSLGISWVKAYKSVSPNVLKFIIKEAHSHNLMVAGDLLKTKPKEAVKMGIDTLEHIELLINGLNRKNNELSEQIYKNWAAINLDSPGIHKLANYLKNKDTSICPTLIVTYMGLFPSHEYSKYMKILFPLDKIYKNKKPKTRFTKIDKNIRKQAFKNILKFNKKLSDSGVRLIAGSDATNPFVVPGFSLHQELKLLVESGLSPISALKSATSEAAKVLGAKDLGHIRTGYKADMILASDYIDHDIKNIDKLTYVVSNGTLIKVAIKDLLSKATLMEFSQKEK